MRFSKMVGRTGLKKKYIYIYIYIKYIYYLTGWPVFMQKKKQNGIGFPLIRKEG